MLSQVYRTFSNCLRIPELRSRLLFTALLLFVCRLVAVTPVPGLDGRKLAEYFGNMASNGGGSSVLGLYSLFTGGALEQCAVGALGIMPYISATIILQLLSAVIPALNKMVREEGGRAKFTAYGRYLTLVLSLGQSLMLAIGWENPERAFQGFNGQLVVIESVWQYRLQTVFILTAGTLLLMWLGEQITERGIGNGVSLVITIGILAQLPNAIQSLFSQFFIQKTLKWLHGGILMLLLFGVVAAVVAITQGQRRIPVQYAQRAVGRQVFAGSSSFLPLKINYAGVMPVIFAQAILMFPGLILEKLSALNPTVTAFATLARLLLPGGTVHLTGEALMIVFFSYFWVATQFNELQIADDLKKYGGYIPGVRPGVATSDFLSAAMSRITFAGAVFLVGIAILPSLLTNYLKIDTGLAQFFGGTSMLITVGVLLDTLRQVESYLLMRHYDGFLKKAKTKGGR
jgi:preprotein translocase subunit SecY